MSQQFYSRYTGYGGATRGTAGYREWKASPKTQAWNQAFGRAQRLRKQNGWTKTQAGQYAKQLYRQAGYTPSTSRSPAQKSRTKANRLMKRAMAAMILGK